MPKLRGPLFSLEARKQLGKGLTYQRRPGGASVYGYQTPKVPLTTAQHTQRDKIMWCVLSWRMLSDAAKAEWEAKAKGQGQSGYSYFVSQTCGYIYDPACVLYLPLFSTDLKGDSFLSRDSYGHLCAVTGAVWGSKGRTFGGNAYIDCGTGASLNLVQEFTLEVVFKYDAPGSYENILFKGNESHYSNWAWSLQKSSGEKIRLIGSNNVDAFTVALASTTAITAGTFWHVAAIYDKNAGNAIVYRNGVADGSGAISGTIADNASKCLFLGTRKRAVPDLFLTGTIGEVRIYNRILTPFEIQDNYLATKWRYG